MRRLFGMAARRKAPVVLASVLVLAMAGVAFASAPGTVIRMGVINTITGNYATTLQGTVSSIVLQVRNNSTLAGSAALRAYSPYGGVPLDLRAKAGNPVMRVNNTVKVPNLNADLLDTRNSDTAVTPNTIAARDISGDLYAHRFYGPLTGNVTGNADTATNAANADLLDGKDSTAFATKIVQGGASFSDYCDDGGLNVWNECATVEIVVPAGKTYNALIHVEGTFYEYAASENRVLLCPSARLSTATGANCGSDEFRAILLKADTMEAATDTNLRTLTAGTWVIAAAVNASDQLDYRSGFDAAKVQTTVILTDASGPALAGLKVNAVKPAGGR
jgi:hypothetical protein